MGFVWVHVESFLHCVASPFHSFVTTDAIIPFAARHPDCPPTAYLSVSSPINFPAFPLLAHLPLPPLDTL